MTSRVERDPTGLLKQILLRTLLCHNQESYCQPGGKGRSLVALHTGHPPSVKRMTHVRKGLIEMRIPSNRTTDASSTPSTDPRERNRNQGAVLVWLLNPVSSTANRLYASVARGDKRIKNSDGNILRSLQFLCRPLC